MTGVVISYRRADSRWIVGRIYDRLEAQFGRDAVFMDIDGIPLGQDFRIHLKDVLDRASALIAVIGPHWLKDANGTSRLQDEADWVRLEIETALARGIPVIPVLIDETQLPQASELPPGLRDLAFRQSARVNTDIDFQPNMERLIRVVAEYVKDVPKSGAAEGGVSASAGASAGAAGEGGTASRDSAGERIAAVAGKINTFSPVRFVMRWMLAAFLVYVGYQIFFDHSAKDDKDDKDDKDKVESVSAPATPAAPAATGANSVPGAAMPNVGAIISAALQPASGGKAQWKAAVDASAGCWHRMTGDDNKTFGAYVRLVPFGSGVDIGTGKEAGALKKKRVKLERHRLSDDSTTVGRLIFSVPPWTITNDTVGHLFVLDAGKADGAGAQLMYEKIDCPD